jgi:DNA primase
MSINREFLEQLRARVSIVQLVGRSIPVTRKGMNHWACCPFHGEKTPSFAVNDAKGYYHCFGCGAHGDIITFVMQTQHLSFIEAVERLAMDAGLEMPKTTPEERERNKLSHDIYGVIALAAEFFQQQLREPAGAAALAYLQKRRLSEEIIANFRLGFAPNSAYGEAKLVRYLENKGVARDKIIAAGLAKKSEKDGSVYDYFRNRVMFPIMDSRGRPIAFGGRVMDDTEPKYLNSPETPVFSKNRNLFALNFARKFKADEVIVVEGYMDALALYQAGFESVVAALGTATGREHARALNQYFRGKTAVLLFDSDAAGEAAVLRAIPILRKEGTPIKILRLEGAKDPDEFLVNYGAEAFAEVLRTARLPQDFQLDLLKKQLPEDGNRLIAYVNGAADIFAEISDPIARDIYVNALSAETGVPAETIRGKINNILSGDIPDSEIMKNTPAPRIRSALPDGLMAAYRNVLYVMATHINLYGAVKNAVSADEILFPAYKALYAEICGRRDKKGECRPADFNFEDPADQSAVSGVFANPMSYENESLLKLALNQYIKFIKDAYIGSQIEGENAKNNPETLQTLAFSRIYSVQLVRIVNNR